MSASQLSARDDEASISSPRRQVPPPSSSAESPPSEQTTSLPEHASEQPPPQQTPQTPRRQSRVLSFSSPASPPLTDLSTYSRSMLQHTKQQLDATPGSPPPPHLRVAGPAGHYHQYHQQQQQQQQQQQREARQQQQETQGQHNYRLQTPPDDVTTPVIPSGMSPAGNG